MSVILEDCDWKFSPIASYVEHDEITVPRIAKTGRDWFEGSQTVVSSRRSWTNFILTAKTSDALEMLGMKLLNCQFNLEGKEYTVARILGFKLGPTITVQCAQRIQHHG